MTSEIPFGQNVINAQNLNLRRGADTLIKDISWQVERGQHWAILGANGAGKTLLMRMLTGYIWPTRGSVEILGRTLGRVDLRVLRRSLGWVAKALEELTPPETTVLEVILSGPEASLGLYIEPEARQVREAEELAEEYGLGRLMHREFWRLSSGEKQRALLARAAAGRPAMMFLDEPMSNLDMGGREQFMALLEKLSAAPGAPTIILTTHNTLEIGSFMTHALMLKGGQVTASGPMGEVMTADTLKATFELPLKVERSPSGRYLAYI